MDFKRITTIILTIIIISMTAIAAKAIEEDFTAFSNHKTIDSCACELIEEKTYIHNTGDITSTYIVDQEGTGAKWSSLAPPIFSLKPGQKQEITTYLNIPCDARGKHKLNTIISTTFDKQQVMEQYINVDNCPNVQITQTTDMKEICPCSSAIYGFKLKNTGKHTETYDINVEPYGEFITLSDPKITLKPGEEQPIYAHLNMPCDLWGEQEFSLNAFAENTKILGQSLFKLNISPCYEYSFDVPEEVSVCLNEMNHLRLSVNNHVNIANKYFFNIEGPEWTYFINNTAFAWGEENTNAELIIEPYYSEGLPEEENITINAISERGRLEESKNTTIRFDNCHDLDIAFRNYQLGVLKETPTEIGVLLRNPGIKTTRYLIENSHPDWIQMNIDPYISLKPGEEKEFTITATIPEYVNNTQEITVYGTLLDQGSVRSNFFHLYPKTEEMARTVDIDVKDQTLLEDGIIEIPVRNSGMLKSDYWFFITAPDWVTLKKNKFSMEPGEQKTLKLEVKVPESSEYDSYKIIVDATPHATGIYYTEMFNLNIREKTYITSIKENLNNIAFGLIFLLIIFAIILFISLKRKKTEQKFKDTLQKRRLIKVEKIDKNKKRSKWWIIPLITILVILITTISFIGANLIKQENSKLEINITPENVILQEDNSNVTIQSSETNIIENKTTNHTEELIIDQNTTKEKQTLKESINTQKDQKSNKKLIYGIAISIGLLLIIAIIFIILGTKAKNDNSEKTDIKLSKK